MIDVNSDKFFAAIRPLFGGKFTSAQVASINALLTAGKALPNKESFAYLLATAWHETAHTMLPIAEYGKGKGRDYGKMLDMGKGPGKRVPYASPNQLYYGRGYVQITWLTNYRSLSRIVGRDLINNPDLALMPDVAVKIAMEGMLRGFFTGKRLKDYFPSPSGKHDPLNARRIINGMDCAATIAKHYVTFLLALNAA